MSRLATRAVLALSWRLVRWRLFLLVPLLLAEVVQEESTLWVWALKTTQWSPMLRETKTTMLKAQRSSIRQHTGADTMMLDAWCYDGSNE